MAKVLKRYNESELIEALKAGDESAYSTLMQQHKGLVYSTVVSMIGKVQEADDVAQDVFIRFFRGVHNFKGNSKISTYLTRIAINLSLNELERRKRNWKIFKNKDDLQYDALPEHSCQSSFDERELVRLAIMKLKPKYRKIVVLRGLHGYSFKEVAETLEMPIGSVLSSYTRAQKKLFELLNPIINDTKR